MMGLKLYNKKDDVFYEISSDDMTNPVTTVHDGRTGDTQTVQLFIRNDDITKWFSNIEISSLDLVDANPYGDVYFSETGWGVKLSSSELEPNEDEWTDISWGNRIMISAIGADTGADTTTYYPFWYLVTCPPNTNAIIKEDIVLNVSYTENSVI
jgi:hypothetical protein